MDDRIYILMVDDKPENLVALESIIGDPSYILVKVNSGRDALREVLRTDFALILLDIQMPEIDGYEIARIIRQRDRSKNTPIIFLTAINYDEKNVLMAYEKGAVDILFKPINAVILKSKVNVFVELYRKTRDIERSKNEISQAKEKLEIQTQKLQASEEQLRTQQALLQKANHQLEENVKLLDEKKQALTESNTALEREKGSLEIRVRERTTELHEKNKELVDFLYIASHDLQEPLRKVQGFGDMLKRKYTQILGDEGAGYIDRMQSASGRMQNLIDALLLYSRVTTKVNPFEPTDLTQLAEDVVSDLEFSIEKAGAKVTIGKLPVIDADRFQIGQVFQNLISNALKFRKENVSPEIKIVQITDHVDSSERIILAVEDNGIGIDEKYSDKVFEVFQKLHSQQEYAGTGIGLAICKKIIERHGGILSFRSKPGEGSQFIINLPVIKKMNDDKKNS
ncbi:MAG: ATP-binding protein [Prolixibacteraceae bacterium]